MLPKEHGAYALVIAPLLTAFCRGGASWVGAGLALATLALFLAHEPGLVMLAQEPDDAVRARLARELGRTIFRRQQLAGGSSVSGGGDANACASACTPAVWVGGYHKVDDDGNTAPRGR